MKKVKLWIVCLSMIIGLVSCQKTEKCIFYASIYKANGELVTTLGPFGNEDIATDEANDFIQYKGEEDYSYSVELKPKSGCRESEQ